MIGLGPERIAAEIGGEIAGYPLGSTPQRAAIDSREVPRRATSSSASGACVPIGCGMPRRRSPGCVGAPAELPLAVAPRRRRAGRLGVRGGRPVAGPAEAARAWRRELGCPVVGMTGSTGKASSVKDIARALLPGRVHASSENFNTEIGLPLTILAPPAGTELLVLEMAMPGDR